MAGAMADPCLHNWHHGLMTMANGHLIAAIPNTRMPVPCMIQATQRGILTDPPAISRAGY